MKPKATIPKDVQDSLNREQPDEKAALEKVWAITAKDAPAMPGAAVDDAVAQFEQQLRKATPVQKSATMYVLRQTWKVAATLVILALAIAWYGTRTITHEVPAGVTAQFTLPDGSSVALNSASTISYGRNLWGKTRAVYLAGEAFFDVAHGTRPFVVTTANARIQVVGTAFNVNTWAPDSLQKIQQTILQVTEGTVHFTASTEGTTLAVVEAGQESRVIGNAGNPSAPVPYNQSIANMWTEGGIASIDQALPSLAQLLERKYAVSIQVAPPLHATILTWIAPNPAGVQESLAAVCEIAGCSVSQSDAGFKLDPLP
ncbi:MAG: FecR domain-containing protein [Bacteroidota bacterium]